MKSPIHARGPIRVVLASVGIFLFVSGFRYAVAGLEEKAAISPDKPVTVSATDRLFVAKPGQEGVFTEVSGRVTSLTAGEIIIDADGRQTLYERKTVHRVMLSHDQPDEIKNLVTVYWNHEESRFVSQLFKALQGTPIIGPALSVLDNLYAPVRMIFAVLILLGLLTYAAYKVYEILFVATSMRNLNIDKLNMEVRKLRYELEALEKKIGVRSPQKAMATEIDTTEQAQARYHFELPPLHILDFMKYKILRLFTSEEKQKITEEWQSRWRTFQDKPKTLRWLGYQWFLAVKLIVVFFLAIFAATFFANTFTSINDPTLGASFSVIFFILFMLTLPLLVRQYAKRRIMQATYKELFPN